jgi:hypothetical protein
MRLGPVALLSIFALAGCAGQIRDYVGPRSSIVTPQLIRYGLDLAQVRCVGGRLGDTLRPLQLRRFARAAGAVRQGYYDPSRLTMRDLLWVATSMGDREVPMMLERANGACGVSIAAAPPAETRPGVAGVTILGPGTLPPPSGPQAPRAPRGSATAAAAPRAAAWLNLGAAGSGQSIAIDAATVEQEGSRRSAWFRLTDPGARAPSPDTFLLHIDCARRTINAKARERRDATGAVVDRIVYPDNPLPVEGGTVMEIAYLSLCT